MGLFSKFFGGGGGSADGDAREGNEVDYQGFKITPAAQPQNGQWLTAGVIRKEVGGEVKEHRFLRADTHASAEAANDFAVIKARQIIDEQGERIFRD
ncbi:HlyU family transcriptional regulator [Pelagibius marinus]|uniref:HlyU family transcriptional regulator n=1 Tax=Pelagibius marinus TaxID=2762760 RepID=UPI0018724810|nr:HlyU family transcriptional regulator [Pelagibius marinus]